MTSKTGKPTQSSRYLIPHQHFLEVEDSAYLIKALCSTHPVFCVQGRHVGSENSNVDFKNDTLE